MAIYYTVAEEDGVPIVGGGEHRTWQQAHIRAEHLLGYSDYKHYKRLQIVKVQTSCQGYVNAPKSEPG